MVALYLTSPEKGSGKTTIGAGIFKHLRDGGRKAGFFKPVIADSKNPPAAGSDRDAAFIKHLFALEEPSELLCPVFSDESQLKSQLKEVYARVAQGKDVVIIEGISSQSRVSRDVVEMLDARVIVVEGYSREPLKALKSYTDFGEHLLGLVINKVPRNRVEQVGAEIAAPLSKGGINMLGVLSEDRTLLALTMGELVEYIQGEIMSGAEQSAELVENIMLGANCLDPGPYYFGRKANKAVILNSERPDMQMAALETPTRCLILTGNTAPMPVVVDRAKEKNVPIILTKGDVRATLTSIEDALGKARFNQENKLARLTEIMERHFDFATVYQGLGLAGWTTSPH